MDALQPASFDPRPVPAPPPPRRSPPPASPVFPGATSKAPMGFSKPQGGQGAAPRAIHEKEVPATCKDGFVPADVANQKLWRVTTEYENLLALQKEHQALVARRREAELEHLRAVAAMLSGEGGEEETAASARLRAQEQEAALTMQARQAELALLAAVLALRDGQAQDLRYMCEAKRMQIRHLQTGGLLEKAAGDSWTDVERLRGEVGELEAALAGKQQDLRGLASTLEARNQKAAELQAEVAEAEKELSLLASASAAGSPTVGQEQAPLQKAEIPLQAAAMAKRPQVSLQERVEATRAQMAEAQQALGHMVRSNAHNNRLVSEMTGAVSATDVGASHEEDAVAESLLKVAVSVVSEPAPTPLTSLLWPDSAEPIQMATPTSSMPASPIAVPSALAPEASATPSLALQFPMPEAPVVGSAPDSEAPISRLRMERSERTQSPPSARPDIDEPWHFYKPYPGDAIDAKVAQFVNQPRNRLRRALFSRLSAGEYLYGTRRARLRLSDNLEEGQLEAREASSQEEERAGDHCPANRNWAAVEEFARRLERSQSNRLRRARDRARWVAGTV